MVECKICNRSFSRITRSHLKKHDLTTTEYVSLFPTSELISSELKHLYGKAFRKSNPMHNEESKNKVINSLIGKPKSEDHKKKLSLAREGKSWGSHTKEHKARMVEISRKNMNERLEEGWRPPSWTDEQRIARSLLMSGNQNGKNGHHNKGLTLELSDSQRLNRSIKRSKYMSENKIPSTFTSIEIKCASFLSENNIEYVSQFVLITEKCSWVFDFYIPSMNLLIEIDGEYWHSKPMQINRDVLKTNAAKNLGYRLLRLSDTDLNFKLIFENTETIDTWSNDVLTRRTDL